MTRMMIRGLSGGGFGFALFVVSVQAWAFGLGNIHVRSYLGQPFSATIPIQVDSPSDLNGLKITLGSPAQFSNAGIEASAADYSLHFKVDGNSSHPFVQITSRRPIRVPFLNFIVQAQWSAGTLLRQYTVLIDPMEYGGKSNSVQSSPLPSSVSAASSTSNAPALAAVSHRAKTSVAPSSAPVTSVSEKMPSPSGEKSSAGPAGLSPLASNRIPDGSLYGPIKPGELFWSIASRARPPGNSVSMDQVLLAIYRANPRAFAGGNFNKLMKGRTLRIPTAQAMRRVGKNEAHRRVVALMRGTAAVAGPVTGSVNHPPSSGTSGKNMVRPEQHSAPSASNQQTSSSAQGSNALVGARKETTRTTESPALLKLATESNHVVGLLPTGPSRATTLPPGSGVHPEKASVVQAGNVSIATIAGSVIGSGTPSFSALNSQSAAPGASVTKHSVTATAAAKGRQSVQGGGTKPGASSSIVAIPVAGLGVTQQSVPAPSPKIDIAAIASGVLAAPPRVSSTNSGAAVKQVANPAMTAHASEKQSSERHSTPSNAGHKITEQSGAARSGWIAWVRQWRKPAIGFLIVFILLAIVLRRRRAISEHAVQERSGAPRVDEMGGSEIALESTSERRAPVFEATEESAGVADSEGVQHGVHVDDSPDAAAEEAHPSVTDDIVSGHAFENQPAPVDDSKIGSSAAAQTRTFEDPLGDADFHIEYGLYDEAIRILNASLEEDPERLDVKLKLAECYAAVENAVEFERVAGELHGVISQDDWQRLAETGRRLSPEASLFQSSEQPDAPFGNHGSVAAQPTDSLGTEEADEEAHSGPETSIHAEYEALDLSKFDEEPDETAPSLEPSSLGDTEKRQGPAEEVEAVLGGDPGVTNPEDGAGSPFDADHLIEFNAEDDLGEKVEAAGVDSPETVSGNGPSKSDMDRVNLNPDGPDTSEGQPLKATVDTSEVTTLAASGTDDLSTDKPHDSPDGSVDTGTGSSETESSETGYKLDLARAYADMGDNDAARELIDEVIHEGDGDQQVQARKLLEELAG